MTVQTLKLVHDGTDIVDAVGQLNLHCFLDDAHQRVALLHGAEVVQTVGQSQRLRIGH